MHRPEAAGIVTWYLPAMGHHVPRQGNALTRALGRWVLRAAGWTLEGEIPNIPKFMILVAPHTSNWDFGVSVATKLALNIKVSFFGKHTLFRGPLGIFMRALGGIPVLRHAPRNVVEQTIDQIKNCDQIVLALSPEGTRRKLPAWRTGFHYVAWGARLPILPVALDYSRKTVRFFGVYHPVENVETNVAELGRNFTASMAYHPDQY